VSWRSFFFASSNRVLLQLSHVFETLADSKKGVSAISNLLIFNPTALATIGNVCRRSRYPPWRERRHLICQNITIMERHLRGGKSISFLTFANRQTVCSNQLRPNMFHRNLIPGKADDSKKTDFVIGPLPEDDAHASRTTEIGLYIDEGSLVGRVTLTSDRSMYRQRFRLVRFENQAYLHHWFLEVGALEKRGHIYIDF
jgi:hypothetical protein